MSIDAETVLQKLRAYKDQILQTDIKVHQFISDRRKYSHPRHEELISEIRQFENKIYNVSFGFSKTEIHLRMDNLLYSVLVYERSWKRLFELGAETDQQEKEAIQGPPPEADTISHPLMDKVYEVAKKKLNELGIMEMEPKAELAKRILPAYNDARRNLKKGQKIALAYDAKTRRINLKIKEIGT